VHHGRLPFGIRVR